VIQPKRFGIGAPREEKSAGRLLAWVCYNLGMDTPPTRQDRSAARREDEIVFRRSVFFAALLPITFILGIAVGYIFWGRGNASQTAAAVQTAVPTAVAQADDAAAGDPTENSANQQNVRRYDVPADDDYAFGPDDAPITLIEFSDYECPYCRKWHLEVWPRLQEAFPGQIRLVYRDFPLYNIHPNANPAAEAANCAGEQGKYWDFHTMLFAGGELGNAVYEQYAKDLDLNLAKFAECLSTNRTADEVQADFDYAANLGISSTPTFFINGLAVVGAQPFETFQQIIEQELAGQIP